MADLKTVTDASFDADVASGTVIVDFWAPWCGPCLMMGPTIEKLAGDYAGKAKVGKVNVDENPEMANKYGIRSIPALMFFKGGEVVDMMVGVQSEDVLKAKLDGLMD